MFKKPYADWADLFDDLIPEHVASVIGWVKENKSLVLSVLAVTRTWTPPRLRGFELPFTVLAVGFAVVLVPGGVYLQTVRWKRRALMPRSARYGT